MDTRQSVLGFTKYFRRTLIATSGILLFALAPTVFAAANIAISLPTANSTVSRTFDLRGTVSEGGGSLALQIDGNPYIPSALRSNTDPIPEGPYFGETKVGEKNVPFQTSVDLTGQAVLINGKRGEVPAGKHSLTVCQLLGPQTGCSTALVVNLSDSTSQQVVATSSPAATEAAQAKTNFAADSITPTVGLLGGAFLGALLVLLAHRLRPKK